MESMSGGGAEKVLTDMLRHFDYSKYSVTLLLFNATGPHIKSIPDEVEVLSIYKRPLTFFRRCLFSSKSISRYIWRKKMSRLLGTRTFDTIISYLEGYALLLHSFITDRAEKNITWVHINLKINHWCSYIFKSIDEERALYRLMDKVIFVSDGAKEAFKDIFHQYDRLEVIPNIIDRESIVDKASQDVITHDKFTLCNIGRLADIKRHDRLIEVAAILRKRGLDFTIWILGTGDLESQLKKQAKDLNVDDCIKFIGFKENPYPYLKAADIFILTSDTEGYPTVVCEALCLGKPIISTDITGSDTLLCDGAGILTTFNPEDIADQVEKLMTDDDLLRQYSTAALKKSEEFNPNAIISKIEGFI